MKYAIISSKDLLGSENPGMRLDAGIGIMLATFLSPEMDVNARVESLMHFIQQGRYGAREKQKINDFFEQPTVKTAVAKLCKYFGLDSTPRIEANLKEAIIKLCQMRKEEIRREVKVLENKLENILRYE